MKKQLLMLAVALLMGTTGMFAQKKYAVYGIGFYNQENLFDTCHDAGKRDYDFLPGGRYHWDGLKYRNKLHNMAQALADMGTDVLPGVGCAVIGLSEVENDRVMNDLTAQPALKARGYKFIHIEGPDRRGIDCALLYNPALFTVKSSTLYPYKPFETKDTTFHTRGFLTVEGTLAGEDIAVIVCHLPSRGSNSVYREQGARGVRLLKDSLMKANPKLKVLVMGDMNDDPTNKSMTKELRAKAETAQVGTGDMYNPWYNILVKNNTGTLMYRGAWNLFDQIMLTPNMLAKKGQRDYPDLRFFKNHIQRMPYLFQTEGKYKGSPKRTTASGVWLNGYSDHLPVVVYLIKDKK